jgi:hypothetical protein
MMRRMIDAADSNLMQRRIPVADIARTVAAAVTAVLGPWLRRHPTAGDHLRRLFAPFWASPETVTTFAYSGTGMVTTIDRVTTVTTMSYNRCPRSRRNRRLA